MGAFVTPLVEAIRDAFAALIGLWIKARSRSGRFERTVEQGKKINELMQQYVDVTPKLSADRKEELENVMLGSLRAAEADFAEDRKILPDFEQRTSFALTGTAKLFRRTFLFYAPPRWWMWILFALFYANMLFMIYAVAETLAVGDRWTTPKISVMIVALACAVLMRLLAVLLSPRT